MTKFFKPSPAPKDVHVLDVKRGFRRWDESAKRYVPAREGERDAREYYVLRAIVEGEQDECVWDPDARIFPHVPEAGDVWRVVKDGNKTRVELIDSDDEPETAKPSAMASHARVLAGNASTADYLREILALVTLALNELEGKR